MFFMLEGAKANYPTQGTAYVEYPKDVSPDKLLTAVIAVHGSNRGSEDYLETPFYSRQREIALENGCVFAVVSNRSDTWGTDDGLYNIDLLIERVCADNRIRKKVVLWATSAGGVTANRMVIEHPDKVACVIGTFPVYDLMSGFQLSSCKHAWKTKDADAFSDLVKNINPSGFPEQLKKCKFFITHGSCDTAVPLCDNSEKMKQDIGNNVYLQVIEGGVHSTANFEFYGRAVDMAFEYLRELT